MAIDPLNPPPRLQPVMDQDGSLNYDWDRFFQNTYSTVNSVASVSSSPNLLLNSNFHYDGSVGQVTDADGNDAYTAEKWQVNAEMSPSYTIENKDYSLSDPVHSSSLRYKDIQISNYTGGKFFIYQQFNGLNHVRMVKKRALTFSAVCSNAGSSNVAIQFGIYRNYDPTDSLVLSRAINLSPGENFVGATIDLFSLTEDSNITVGSNSFIQFRVYISEFIGNCHVKLHYVKAEFGKVATPLIMDNALERVRIDNA